MRRVRVLVALAALGLMTPACYSLRPAAGVTPELGARVAFDVNDAGRLALGGSMGPEIAQIEGLLVGREGEDYLLSVTAVRLLRGGEQVWTGEQVRLKPEHLATMYERKFSIGRSIALGAVTVGGFTAFLVTRSLLTSGTEDNNNGGVDTSTTRLGRP